MLIKKASYWSTFTLVLTLTAALAASIILLKDQADEPPAPAVIEPTPEITSAQSRLLFTGEVYWSRQYERKRRNREVNSLEFPFSGLSSYDRSQYDAWVAHLECPITDAELTFEDEWNAVALNCRPEFLPEFLKWFDIGTIGHNHIFDIDGEVGYEQTKDNLDQYNFQYFGHFYPAEHSETCEVVTVPINLIYSDDSAKTEDLPIAMCGYNGVFNLPTQADIDVIKKYSEHFFTVAMPQMGREYENVSDELKRQTYRAMVDAGADLIAASHPHAVQETEVYKGKLIVYSLGNFIFDQQDDLTVRSSVALDATLDFTQPNQLAVLKEWLSLEGCIEPKDNCNQVAATNKISKESALPKLKYDLLPGLQTNLVQSKLPATDPNYANILNIAKWEETKRLLNNQ